MALNLSYSSAKPLVNRIFLISSKKELKALKLSSGLEKFFDGKFADETFMMDVSAGTITVICKVGKTDSGDEREKVRLLGHQAYNEVCNKVDAIEVSGGNVKALELFTEGFHLSSYVFDKYLSKKPKTSLKKLLVGSKKVDLKRLKAIDEAVFWARDLVNEPVSYLDATQLAKEFRDKCSKVGIRVEVLRKQRLETLKMGGLLAVNKGSFDPPTFSILEWKPKKVKNKQPIVLIGKGIVFDTGGLSLKPTPNSMDMMKADMGGAAAVAATMLAIAELKLPLHVVCLVPATDNRPGNRAYAPGDIITMFNKMTVEVLNTDAEGRMALADALSYSNKYKPELVIDAATLTGAAARAIGSRASVMMGNAPQKEMDALIEAGYKTHDRVVQFPFWDEYGEEMKSKIADLKNIGGGEAGMITAGKFLEHFTDYPYIHMDIAGPAFLLSKDKYRGDGGTGVGVRLLVEFLSQKAK